MWEIVTGSRLHFGLFQPATAPEGSRQFGGVGMMIAEPGLLLRAEPGPQWGVGGCAMNARFADLVCRYLPQDWQGTPYQFALESMAPQHAGLGTGTQLSLAVAKLMAICTDADSDITALAEKTGRGLRSGIGLHGFVHGGLLVDGGRGSSGKVAPLIARMAVPSEWRVVLVFADGGRDWHGRREQQAFDTLIEPDEQLTDSLCRLALLGVLPALAEGDLESFGEALYEFNVKAGTFFAAAQGGVYASPQVASVVSFLRSLDIRGVGQSSWGPTVFAIVADEEQATHVADRLKDELSLVDDEIIISAPLNEGARVVDLDSGERY